MAKIVGLTVPQFRSLQEKLGRPCQRKDGSGKTSPVLIDSVGWLQVWRAADDGTLRPPTESAYRERLAKAKCELAEMELARARHELLAVEDVNAFVQEWATRMRGIHNRLCRSCTDLVSNLLDVAKQERERAQAELFAGAPGGGDRHQRDRSSHPQRPRVETSNGRPKRKAAAAS